MLTRLVALTAASVLLASSIAVAAPRVRLTSDDQVDSQGRALRTARASGGRTGHLRPAPASPSLFPHDGLNPSDSSLL